jgi:hypothetical protein
VIDAVLDKTIDKIRVKIRYLSGRECYVMDRPSLTPATIDPVRVSVPAARCASNMLIPILTMSDRRSPSCVAHDLPRLADKCVPGVAAVIDDVVKRFEGPV